MTTFDVALAMLQSGQRPIPLTPLGKKPLIRRWQIARLERADLERFFVETTNNLGLVTDGITIVDIDDANYLDWAIGRFGDTRRVVRTPSGGLHLYYAGALGRNWVRLDGKPVDGRSGPGGYVVVPPSRSANGTYELVEDGPLAPFPLDAVPVARPTKTGDAAEWAAFRRRRYLAAITSVAGSSAGSSSGACSTAAT